MNKILTLYDLEFKRVKKVYFSILSLLALGNLGLFIFYLYFIAREVKDVLNIKAGMEILKSEEAYKIIKNGDMIFSLYNFSSFLMILGLIWCVYYTVIIWYKDFFSKTKVVYTLFALPINKFNLYLSKLMIVVSFAYGIIIIQHIVWILEILMINRFTGINGNEIINIINYYNAMSPISLMSGIYPLEMIIYFLIGPIITVFILFTGIMIHKSFNKVGGFLGLAYVILSLAIYFFISKYNITYTDQVLKNHIIYYILVGILSVLISYGLLNKRVHV